MSSVFVLGYGNPLRGDDGIGWAAASKLQERFNESPTINVETCLQLTPELAEQFSENDLVILIDAAANGKPGEISVRLVDPVENHQPINHFSKPETILSMARDLYDKAPKAYIATITGESFEYEDSLSVTVATKIPKLVDLIQEIIMKETKQKIS